MMKRLLSLLMMLILVLTCGAACAEDTQEEALSEDAGADVLTLSELRETAAYFQTLAMASEPLNDPAASQTEDGYVFEYAFGTLFADSPVMAIDTQVLSIVLKNADEQGPRGIQVGDDLSILMQANYSENPSLTGSSESAVLYVVNLLPDSLYWGEVKRDGQRVQTVEYAAYERGETDGDGYSNTGVIFTMEDNLVSAIRIYGLTELIEEPEVTAVLNNLLTSAFYDDYTQVATSADGASLTMFDGNDLLFAGLDFMSLTPDDAAAVLGEPLEDVWMENDSEGYVRTLTYAACDISFLYDMQKENPQVYMLLIAEDGMEGPRASRIGDTLTEVYNRFYHDELDIEENDRKWLYGDEEGGVYGLIDYAADCDVMRFGLVLADGTAVALRLEFVDNVLDEIVLYIQ